MPTFYADPSGLLFFDPKIWGEYPIPLPPVDDTPPVDDPIEDWPEWPLNFPLIPRDGDNGDREDQPVIGGGWDEFEDVGEDLIEDCAKDWLEDLWDQINDDGDGDGPEPSPQLPPPWKFKPKYRGGFDDLDDWNIWIGIIITG